MRNEFCWTHQNVKILRELWRGALSTAGIGTILGCSKNAVIGKAYRLELPKRNMLWTSEEIERLALLGERKIPVKDIATALNRTVPAVRRKNYDLRIQHAA